MYKKTLCLLVLILGFSSAVFAAEEIGNAGSEFTSGVAANDSSSDFNSGIYFGAQFGVANMHYSGSKYTLSRNSYDDSYKFAGRGYFGYAFTQYISTELGYAYYGRPKFKDNTTGNTQDILQQGMDLMIKARLPLDHGFDLYIKGGLAWIFRGALHGNAGTFAEKGANNKFTPIGAVGASYWFMPNMAVDLSWNKTMAVSDLPTIDFIAAGITYRINI